jgi:hypothetical protein
MVPTIPAPIQHSTELEPPVEPCLCGLAFGLVRKLQGTEAKVSGVDIQKNNRAQGSPDGFNNSPFLFLAFSQGQMPNHTGMAPLLALTMLKFPARAIRQEEEIKGIQIGFKNC